MLRLIFPEGRSIAVDFVGDHNRYRRPLRGKQELLAKAVGFAKRKNLKIFDATVGLAEDSWTLIRLGGEVFGCERESLLYEVVRDGIERALQDSETRSWAEAFHLRQGNSVEVLQSLTEDERPDVIVMDPMFPEIQKNALPRLEMQLLRSWLSRGRPDSQLDLSVNGKSEEEIHLWQVARQVAKYRVVVKRHLRSPALAKPSYELRGRTIRYDVYVLGI